MSSDSTGALEQLLSGESTASQPSASFEAP
jgi:hypothetical protein